MLQLINCSHLKPGLELELVIADSLYRRIITRVTAAEVHYAFFPRRGGTPHGAGESSRTHRELASCDSLWIAKLIHCPKETL